MEEKIKTLKKRNAELAAIARRLEEKAKHLQQENMKVAILLLVWERNAMQIETNWQILLSLEQAYHLQFFLVSPLAKQLNESKFEVIISFLFNIFPLDCHLPIYISAIDFHDFFKYLLLLMNYRYADI